MTVITTRIAIDSRIFFLSIYAMLWPNA